MFNSVSYRYIDKDQTYVISAWLGLRFYKIINKLGYPISKHKYLFVKTGMSGLTIHRFFLPDLRAILTQMLELGSISGVNFRTVENLVSLIDNELLTLNKPHDIDMALVGRDFKFAPLPVQLPAYAAYERIRAANGSRGMLLDGAVGVGKTYISLSLATALNSEVTLIVAPLQTVNSVWLDSISSDNSLFKTPRRCYVVGSKDGYNGEDFIISSYENLKHVVKLWKDNNINLSTLIVDEVHNFNQVKSSRTKELMTIVDDIPFLNAIPMSGTPIKAKASDLVPLFKIINKDFSRTIEKRFIHIYSSKGWLRREVLKERYLNHTVVIKKSDIKIPPLTTPTVKIKTEGASMYTLSSISKRMKEYVDSRILELTKTMTSHSDTYRRCYAKAKLVMLEKGLVTNAQLDEYDNNIISIISNYSNNTLSRIPSVIKDANMFERAFIEPNLETSDRLAFRNSKTVHKYLTLKVQGEALANVVMKSRIDCYSELARTIKIQDFINSTVKKTLIFSNYVDVCDAVNSNCVSNKLAPITVYGDTTKHLTRNVNMFINNSKLNPLITTYKSLSTGVPILVANVILIFGLPHRQYVFEQAVGRSWRTGQDKPVKAYIIELDTGDIQNITDRDFDIIEFFRKEVAALTGKDDSVIIDKSAGLNMELPLAGLIEPEERYMDRLLKSTTDVIKEWF